MDSLIRLIAAAAVATACSYLAACGGASAASAYAEELNEPAPASATRGSSLAELPEAAAAP